MGGSWERPYGMPIGCPWSFPKQSWATHGLSIGDLWATDGLPIGFTWSANGIRMGYVWDSHGLPCKTHELPMCYSHLPQRRSRRIPMGNSWVNTRKPWATHELPSGYSRDAYRMAMGWPWNSFKLLIVFPRDVHGIRMGG